MPVSSVPLSETHIAGRPREAISASRIILYGHKTSVSLEDEFWKGLKEVAGRRLMTLSNLVENIDTQRQQGNLSSALRLFVLGFYRSQIPEEEGREGLREMLELSKPALS